RGSAMVQMAAVPPAATPTSATAPGAPVPSTTVAPLMISSSTGSPDLPPEKSDGASDCSLGRPEQLRDATRDETAPLWEAGRRRGVDRPNRTKQGEGDGGLGGPRVEAPDRGRARRRRGRHRPDREPGDRRGRG